MTSSLKSGWVVKPLIEVATLQRGYDLPVQNRSLGKVQIFAANGPVGNHNEAKVSGPGVITGRSGSIGKVHYVESDYWPLNTALYVKDFHGNDPKFIYYLLSTFGLEKYSEGTGVPTLNRNNVHGVNVSLPPLPEQKRIAAILDKADSIRRKRQQAVKLTEELLRSVFLDMFGDPVTNPKGWEVKSLAEEITFMTSGSRGWAEHYSDHGSKFIRIQNVKNGQLHFNDIQYVKAPDNKEAARTKVQENDLLISITADLGRTAVVDKQTADEGAHINQHLALVRLSDAINPHFVAAYLESQGGKRQFLQLDQAAVKSGLNFDSIKSLRIFNPPLVLQEQYAAAVESAENTKVRLKCAADISYTLFTSLLQRAFRGAL